jgi:predicted nucleic-acid-binding Zn-ribbon protein
MGINVQGWIAKEATSVGDNEFIGIACVACGQTHLVNLATGKVLGEQSGPTPKN